MSNSNLRFLFSSFFFLCRYRFFLNLTFLVESVLSFFLDRCRFFLKLTWRRADFIYFLFFSWNLSFINSHLWQWKSFRVKYLLNTLYIKETKNDNNNYLFSQLIFADVAKILWVMHEQLYYYQPLPIMRVGVTTFTGDEIRSGQFVHC